MLTLSRDYFRLRKPTDRRIYELVRKHCGEQDEWKISLELLHKKSGASCHYREFKSMIRELAKKDRVLSAKLRRAVRETVDGYEPRTLPLGENFGRVPISERISCSEQLAPSKLRASGHESTIKESTVRKRLISFPRFGATSTSTPSILWKPLSTPRAFAGLVIAPPTGFGWEKPPAAARMITPIVPTDRSKRSWAIH